ncbi:MAG TPA: DUF4412 domain-containing protein [Thermoanaerobaculia bacterium]
MKRLAIAVFVTLFTFPLFAGMSYTFTTATQGPGSGNMAGKAYVEGSSMRLEFSKGDNMIFRDNTVVISKDGGKSMILLDPKEKTYVEFNLQEMLNMTGGMLKAMGGMFQMSIENPQVKVTEGGAGEAIEGYPTRRYTITSSYDMSMKVMGSKTSSHIETVTESWTTDRIGREYITFVHEKGLKTGMEALDKMLAMQADSIKGFPLKQVMTSKTTTGNRSQTSVMTTTVTGIEKVTVPAAKFEIPAGYTEGESPIPQMPQIN